MKNNTKTKNISITLPEDMINELEKTGNRSAAIQRALKMYFAEEAKMSKFSQLGIEEQMRFTNKLAAKARKKIGRKPMTPEEIIEAINHGRS